MTKSAPTWDLEPIFTGGPAGTAFKEAVAAADARVEALVARADALPPLPEALDAWAAVIAELFATSDSLGQVRVFASCHASADARSGAAQRAYSRTAALFSRLERAWVPVEDGVVTASEEAFAPLAARPELADALPRLRWLRRHAHLRLPRAEAALAAELGRDGIHGWGQLYDQVSGNLTVQLDGEEVSVSQAVNRLSDADAERRRTAHEAIGRAWEGVADTCAAALTHIVGTRQVVDDRRGVDELADTLARNRMQADSLQAMLESARRAGPLLERYLAAKARALGVERLGWSDLSAPLGSEVPWDWERAEGFVLTHFGSYHPELRDYAAEAFRRRWIEAEDRPGKRQGGWCARVPLHAGHSRIFMTWGGNFRSTTTLAHELGHGFHNWALREVPTARKYVPSTLAETASVFAENIVRDAALSGATSDDERLAMLDARLQAGVAFLMNIPFRFALERELYALRREGDLDPQVLSERTVALQKASYRGALASWDPTFWASKLHFYISHFAFYNYPYTFGYLFSGLVYARARAEGPAWHARYLELLQRTGTDDAETLARDYLELDLSDPDAWYGAVAPLEEDLAAFEAIVGG